MHEYIEKQQDTDHFSASKEQFYGHEGTLPFHQHHMQIDPDHFLQQRGCYKLLKQHHTLATKSSLGSYPGKNFRNNKKCNGKKR